MFNLNSHQAASLQVKQVKSLQTSLNASIEKSFNTSLSLASCIFKAYNYMATEECKSLLKEKKVTIEEFIFAVYGFEKSHFYKLKNAGKVLFERPTLVDEFRAAVLEEKTKGRAALSIEGLNSYVKQVDAIKAAASDTAKGETAKGETAKGETAEKAAKEKAVPNVSKAACIVSFAFNGESIGLKNVSLKIDANGLLKSSCDLNDIFAAVDYLRQSVGMGEKVATKATKATKAASKAARRVEVLDHINQVFTSETFDLSEHA